MIDIFCWPGTLALVSKRLDRKWICIDNSPIAIGIAIKKLSTIVNRHPFILVNATGNPLPGKLKEVVQAPA
ncbi:hypothetical protein [Desulfurococcus sp.]|uniref:hypothetical protein n=1 Tax=Desulfurococcus sp. TaxID=51678 RepID=UPI003173589B